MDNSSTNNMSLPNGRKRKFDEIENEAPSAELFEDQFFDFDYLKDQQQQSNQELHFQKKCRKIISPWAILPRAALYIIFQHFSKAELIKLAGVSTHWNRCAKTIAPLWRRFNFEGFKVQNFCDCLQLLSLLFETKSNGSSSSSQYRTSFCTIQVLEFPQRLKMKNTTTKLHEQFSQLVHVAPHLKSIVLPLQETFEEESSTEEQEHQIGSVDDEIVSHLAHLEKLVLSNHSLITDKGLLNLSTNLKELVVDQCNQVTTASLKLLLLQCPKLRVLSSKFCANAQFGEQDFKELMENSLNNKSAATRRYVGIKPAMLQSWSLEVKPNIPSPLLGQFWSQSRTTSRLEILNIRGWNNMEGEDLSRMLKCLPMLKKLSVLGSRDETKLLNPLIESSSLEELVLSQLRSLKFMELGHLPRCKRIHFDSIDMLSDVVLKKELAESALQCGVQELILKSCGIPDLSVEILLRYTKETVRLLELFDCGGVQSFSVEELENLVFKELKMVSLFMCNDLTQLSVRCKSLHSLVVDVCMDLHTAKVYCENLEISEWFKLPQPQAPIFQNLELYSEKMQNLNLQKCVNLRGVKILCNHLKSLNMSDCKVLENLYIKSNSLEKLALSAPRIQISPDFITEMAVTCPKITMLSLANALNLCDLTLNRLCMSFPLLTALICSNCEALRYPLIEAPFLRGIQIIDCPNLQNLKLRNCQHLTKLFIKNTPLLEGSLFVPEGADKSLNNLKSIEISQCPKIKSLIQQNQFMFGQLFELTVDQCESMEEIALPFTPQLKKLVLRQLAHLYKVQFDTNMYQQGITTVETTLSHLPLLDDVSFNNRMPCGKFKSLNVDHCSSLMNPCFQFQDTLQFVDCENLREPRVYIAGDCANRIVCQNCPKLVNLDMNGQVNNFTFKTVRSLEIKNCYGLQKWELNTPKTSSIHQQFCHVGDMKIIQCQNLIGFRLVQPTNQPYLMNNIIFSQCSQLQVVEIDGSNGGKLYLDQCNQIRSVMSCNFQIFK